MTFKSCCLFFLIALNACQSSLSNSPETIAPEARLSLIKGGPYAGSWQSSDVLLNYQYYNHPGEINLTVNGKAKREYDELKVWLLFLDDGGKVLERKLIYARGFLQEPTIGRQYNNSVLINNLIFIKNSLLYVQSLKARFFDGPVSF